MLNFTSAYAADEPEGSRPPGSSYLDRKSAIKMLVGVAALMVLMVPIYIKLKGESEKSRCASNLKAQWQGIELYSVDNDGRYPPAFIPDGTGSPVLIKGYPLTWATIVADRMKDTSLFKCPTAGENECSQTGGKALPYPLAYGLYAPRALKTASDIANPNDAVLIAETMSGGAQNTYNPKPLKDAEGNPLKHDGFLIGFDSGNDPDSETYRAAAYVTRLAFPNTATGKFLYNGPARHDLGVQAITVGGSRIWITPDQAEVERRSATDGDLTGIWSTR